MLKLYRDAWTLYRSEWFDVAWYRQAYPDVRAAGVHPIKHYLLAGAAEGRDPGPRFSSRAYLQRNPDVAAAGLNPLLHFLRCGSRERRQHGPEAAETNPIVATPSELLRAELVQLHPLRAVRLGRHEEPRITLLTDSVSPGSLFGGVGTAILLAAAIARRRRARLRIVNETEPADHDMVAAVFAAHGLEWHEDIDFCYAPRGAGDRSEVELADGDLFLTTSWWSTWNARRSVPARQIVYLLQEDERMFYPHGDLHLRCCETLSDPELRFVVNSRLLFEHFVGEGFDNIRRKGVWFEPAFPTCSYYWERGPERAGAKRIFLFYARPKNPRNLYLRGLEAIAAAVEEGVLDLSGWEVVFAGRDLVPVSLPGGVIPRLVQNVSWREYAALIRSVDLGLCLMYTPHPSYPPLDLAASGGVAVTNRFGPKLSLQQYSQNILCTPCDLDSLVDGIAKGALLATDLVARRRNYESSGLGRDWSAAFAPVLDNLFAMAEI